MRSWYQKLSEGMVFLWTNSFQRAFRKKNDLFCLGVLCKQKKSCGFFLTFRRFLSDLIKSDIDFSLNFFYSGVSIKISMKRCQYQPIVERLSLFNVFCCSKAYKENMHYFQENTEISIVFWNYLYLGIIFLSEAYTIR